MHSEQMGERLTDGHLPTDNCNTYFVLCFSSKRQPTRTSDLRTVGEKDKKDRLVERQRKKSRLRKQKETKRETEIVNE